MGGIISNNDTNIYDLFTKAFESIEYKINVIPIQNHYNLIEILIGNENLNDIQNFHKRINKFELGRYRIFDLSSLMEEETANVIMKNKKLERMVIFFYCISDEPINNNSQFTYDYLDIYKHNNICSDKLLKKIFIYCDSNLKQITIDLNDLNVYKTNIETYLNTYSADEQIGLLAEENRIKQIQEKEFFKKNLEFLQYCILLNKQKHENIISDANTFPPI